MQGRETLKISKGGFDWQGVSIQENHITAVLKKFSSEKHSVDDALIALKITATLLYHRLCMTLETDPNDSALIALIESSEIQHTNLSTEGNILQSHFEALSPAQNPKWNSIPVAHMRYLAVCILILRVYYHQHATRSQITTVDISSVDTPTTSSNGSAAIVEVDTEPKVDGEALGPTLKNHHPASDSAASCSVTGTIPPEAELVGNRKSISTSTASRSSVFIGIAAMGIAATLAIKTPRSPTASSTHMQTTSDTQPTQVDRQVAVPVQTPTLQTTVSTRTLPQVESSGRFVSPSNPTRALFEIAIRTALAQKRDELGRCLSNLAHTQHLISGLTRRISDQLAQANWHVGDPHLPTGLTLQWTSGNCRSFHVIRWQMLGTEPRTERETDVIISANANDIVQQRLLLQRQRSR